MVSLISLVSVIFALAAFSRAAEVADQNEGQVHSKRFYNTMGAWGGLAGGLGCFGGWNLYLYPWLYSWNALSAIYGYSIFNSNFYGYGFNGFFAKATNNDKLARRAVSLNADQLYPRDSASTFTCTTEKGESAVFVTDHCTKAAQKMTEHKLTSASCGSCSLSLVSSAKDRMVPKNLPGDILVKTAHGIMKACSQPRNSQHARRSSVDNSNNEEHVAMILAKGDNSSC